MPVNKNNKYLEEINGMLMKPVIVKDGDNTEHIGILKGFYMPHLNVIVETEKYTVLIRNWISMKRLIKNS